MVYFMENTSINGCWLGVPWKQPCPIYWLVNGSGKKYGLSSSRINHGNPVMAHVYIHRSFIYLFKFHGFSLAMFIAVPDCSLPTPYPLNSPTGVTHCSDRIRAWYLLLVSLSKHGIPKQWENIGKYGNWVVIEVTYSCNIPCREFPAGHAVPRYSIWPWDHRDLYDQNIDLTGKFQTYLWFLCLQLAYVFKKNDKLANPGKSHHSKWKNIIIVL